MNDLVKFVTDFVDSLPQTSFNDVRAARSRLPDSAPEQIPLAREDRRAFAREVVAERGLPAAASLAVAVPMEQGAKAVLETPVAGDAVKWVLEQIGHPYNSRSGSADPAGQIKAGYSGILQGLDDRGMFGRVMR